MTEMRGALRPALYEVGRRKKESKDALTAKSTRGIVRGLAGIPARPIAFSLRPERFLHDQSRHPTTAHDETPAHV